MSLIRLTNVLVSVILVSLFIPVLDGEPQDASANTVYTAYGEGNTWQNNWASSCRWINTPGHPDNSPCYRGVWSDTDTQFSQDAKVDEWAESWKWTCIQYCSNSWVVLAPAHAVQQALSYATVNHCCGVYIDGNPVNVRGGAWHWNPSLNPSFVWYTSQG